MPSSPKDVCDQIGLGDVAAQAIFTGSGVFSRFSDRLNIDILDLTVADAETLDVRARRGFRARR